MEELRLVSHIGIGDTVVWTDEEFELQQGVIKYMYDSYHYDENDEMKLKRFFIMESEEVIDRYLEEQLLVVKKT